MSLALASFLASPVVSSPKRVSPFRRRRMMKSVAHAQQRISCGGYAGNHKGASFFFTFLSVIVSFLAGVCLLGKTVSRLSSCLFPPSLLVDLFCCFQALYKKKNNALLTQLLEFFIYLLASSQYICKLLFGFV